VIKRITGKASLSREKIQITDSSFSHIIDGITFKSFRRFFPHVKILYQAFELIGNTFRFYFFCKKYKPDIVYGFSENTSFYAALIKKFFNYKLIFDIRGEIVDEYTAKGKGRVRVKIVKNLLSYTKRKSDLIFRVNASIDENHLNKTHVKYNYYDKDIFSFNQELTNKVRADLGLKDKFVFVYSGSDHYYQNIPSMINFFKGFNLQYNNSHFLILTQSSQERFIEQIKLYGLSENCYSIFSVSHKEISIYQSAGNVAFLLRDNNPLNRKSFPTKFCEYLASGLPVITTKSVNTISSWIEEYGLGEIIELEEDYTRYYPDIFTKYTKKVDVKISCAQFAIEKLSWQKNAKNVYERIISVC